MGKRPGIVALAPDDLIEYGTFLQDIATGGTSRDFGLAPALAIARGVVVPVPDAELLPGGAVFARSLNGNARSLQEALEEVAHQLLALGRAVEHIGAGARSAEDLRTAAAESLKSRLRPVQFSAPAVPESPTASESPAAPDGRPEGSAA
ncbi:hypothetical protein AB0C77_13820 [Streptomyces sp. NPDC048629]|uniref:hypothetical protein n=1 Tax=Streptomyces sp. NPDC048629 TaxID=3154824 RepID=UPI00342CF846